MNQRRRKRNKIASLYIWHRYAGLFAAIFAIFISISGIILNHTDDLGLKKRHLSISALLEQYQVQNPTVVTRFKSQQQFIEQADDMLFIGPSEVIHIDTPLIGAVQYGEFLVVGLQNSLLLFSTDGQLLETLTRLDGVPSHISHIGIDQQQQLVLLSKARHYRLNDDLSLQLATLDSRVNWSQAQILATADKAAIKHRYRSNIISLETLLLDIHSGRFFGAYGALIFDLIGLIILFLAASGCIIWFKQRPKKTPR